MPVGQVGDPRLQALFGASDPRGSAVRPTVRLPHRGLRRIAIGFGAVILGVLLFLVLNQRRASQEQPSVRAAPVASGVTTWAAPPPLYIPPVQLPVPSSETEQPKAAAPVGQSAAMTVPGPVEPRVIYQRAPLPQLTPPAPLAPAPRVSSGSPLVIDTGRGPGIGAGSPPPAAARFVQREESATRVRASTLANRSMTVPQGYLIPAVLETGFDSTKPGFARAVVSRDVRGFDGSNVLIPRGSRLIGEYRADVSQGQKRAIITWNRLIRPDGMTIQLDSPAVDTLGRGGVPAHVNTHFLSRVGDALLQSTVGLGSALAQRAATGPVVVLPGAAAPAAAQIAPTTSYVPTLTVAAGKSISVFVAHDLDFSVAGKSE